MSKEKEGARLDNEIVFRKKVIEELKAEAINQQKIAMAWQKFGLDWQQAGLKWQEYILQCRRTYRIR